MAVKLKLQFLLFDIEKQLYHVQQVCVIYPAHMARFHTLNDAAENLETTHRLIKDIVDQCMGRCQLKGDWAECLDDLVWRQGLLYLEKDAEVPRL